VRPSVADEIDVMPLTRRIGPHRRATGRRHRSRAARRARHGTAPHRARGRGRSPHAEASRRVRVRPLRPHPAGCAVAALRAIGTDGVLSRLTAAARLRMSPWVDDIHITVARRPPRSRPRSSRPLRRRLAARRRHPRRRPAGHLAVADVARSHRERAARRSRARAGRGTGARAAPRRARARAPSGAQPRPTGSGGDRRGARRRGRTGHRVAFERDRERDAALTALGYVVLRFTWRQLTREPMVVVARLAAVLSPPGPARGPG
jgi:hypothetical protein